MRLAALADFLDDFVMANGRADHTTPLPRLCDQASVDSRPSGGSKAMEFHFPCRGQVEADHQWLARTVGIAQASGMIGVGRAHWFELSLPPNLFCIYPASVYPFSFVHSGTD